MNFLYAGPRRARPLHNRHIAAMIDTLRKNWLATVRGELLAGSVAALTLIAAAIERRGITAPRRGVGGSAVCQPRD